MLFVLPSISYISWCYVAVTRHAYTAVDHCHTLFADSIDIPCSRRVMRVRRSNWPKRAMCLLESLVVSPVCAPSLTDERVPS
jgi:hypothetical protein